MHSVTGPGLKILCCRFCVWKLKKTKTKKKTYRDTYSAFCARLSCHDEVGNLITWCFFFFFLINERMFRAYHVIVCSIQFSKLVNLFEPRHEKTCLCHLRTITAEIRTDWLASLWFAACAFFVRCLNSIVPILFSKLAARFSHTWSHKTPKTGFLRGCVAHFLPEFLSNDERHQKDNNSYGCNHWQPYYQPNGWWAI